MINKGKMLLAAGACMLCLPAIATAKKPAAKAPGTDRQKYEIITDSEGVMRRSDNGREVSYYGTNYTAPFAYSYRALGYEGKDVRQAIDRDVYHIARLGLNAFRLHLWDAELADSAGNLVQNEHLDLLDYLIAQFEKRGIDIVLTAQTNFGNGYPEKDIDTGSFTYDFEKCKIHDNAKAQAAQERYLAQLVKHRNPYTGRTYAADKAIVAIEINNEPCHSGNKKEVTAYIDKMSRALRRAGYKRPIWYNVTHNPGVTSAYYDANDIQGTTYQWYPTGLVAGHERKGNFLPALDNYTIPWEDTIPNYGKLSRAVYEFDPADVLYSHLYPAIARTFRGKGFQWITQFAYDPIDLAQYNTEYPTHYMNLAYTPAKALSMMIAAEAARETPRGADYGKYPDNTRFGHTTVSHDPDLSIFNAPAKYIYTNTTTVAPVAADSLRLVAGHGSSPLVSYAGTGAYFLDATQHDGVWRLEVLPDITQMDDPFGNTSLNDAKIITTSRQHPMTLRMPQLGADYTLYDLAGHSVAKAADGTVTVEPGTWVLVRNGVTPDFGSLADETVAGNIGMQEYVMPSPARLPISLLPPRQGDTDVDVNSIPEAWDFRFEYRNPNWHDPQYYLFSIDPKRDGETVVRRRVGDKLAKAPANVHPTQLKVQFRTTDPENNYAPVQLPAAGTEVAVVSREGYTYSAPLTFNDKGLATVELSQLQPRQGIIMPAPYPTMVTRSVPVTDRPLGDFRNIEFIEMIVPTKSGQPQHMLLQEIWME